MHPGLKDSQGTKGLRALPGPKVRREFEDRQEDLDRGLLGLQDLLRVKHDPVPQGIPENEGYPAIPVTEENLEHQAREEEKDTRGFQEIGGSKAQRGILVIPVSLVLWDPPVRWEAGRVVRGS